MNDYKIFTTFLVVFVLLVPLVLAQSATRQGETSITIDTGGTGSGLGASTVLKSDGASCSVASECTGGFCNSGVCASSAPSVAPSAAGAAAAPTPSVAVEVTKTISSASPTSPAVATIETDKAKDLKVDKVTVQVKEAISNVEVKVKESSLPSGASVAITTDKGATYKYVEITTNVATAKLEKVKINFKVEKSWITSNNIDEEKVALQKYADNKWNKLNTTKASSDATYVYYEAETAALSVFAITGEKKVAVAPPVEEKKCPTCPSPSDWSDCVAEKQTRTNYKCSAETNYECQTYTEEQACKVTVPEVPKAKPLLTYVIFGLIVIAAVGYAIYKFSIGKRQSRYSFKLK